MRDPKAPVVLRLPRNTRGRDFYVGDLQGCLLLLHELLDRVNFDSSVDRLICVGNVIGVRDPLISTALIEEPWFFTVLGLHEMKTLSALEPDTYGDWEMVGGDWEHQEWTKGLSAGQRTQVLRRLESLPIAMEVEQPHGRLVGVIPAEIGARPGWSDVHELDSLDLIRPLNAHRAMIVRHLVCGHFILGMTEDALGIHNSFRGHPTGYLRRRSMLNLTRPTAGIDLLISGFNITHDLGPFAFGNRLYLATGPDLNEGLLTLVELRTRQYRQAYYEVGSGEYPGVVMPQYLPKPLTTRDLRLGLLRQTAAAMKL